MIFFWRSFLTAKSAEPFRLAVSLRPFPTSTPPARRRRRPVVRPASAAYAPSLRSKAMFSSLIDLIGIGPNWCWPFFSSIMDKLDNKHAFPEEMILMLGFCLSWIYGRAGEGNRGVGGTQSEMKWMPKLGGSTLQPWYQSFFGNLPSHPNGCIRFHTFPYGPYGRWCPAVINCFIIPMKTRYITNLTIVKLEL